MEEILNYDQTDDGVPEEFKPLVAGGCAPGLLVVIGFMCERLDKQSAVPELVACFFFEGCCLGLSGRAMQFGQAVNFLKMRLALVPPKPNELDMAQRTSVFLALFGT